MRPHALRSVLAAALLVGVAGNAGARTHVIRIHRMAFEPALAQVRAGDVVEWRNEDVVPHTATSVAAGFDVEVAPGRRAQTPVAQTGDFEVICRYHPSMHLRLVAK
jgi:plastocyanin